LSGGANRIQKDHTRHAGPPLEYASTRSTTDCNNGL